MTDATHDDDLARRLRSETGPRWWRSLGEAADSPAFRERLAREFPREAALWSEGLSRRGFLHLAAASLGLAGVTGCTRQPPEQILPYTRRPEDVIPGRPSMYATALSRGGFGLGVLGESHEGRPTKIEGNPTHPTSRGATDVWAQAAVLGLYDPDRSTTVTHLQDVSTWSHFRRAFGHALGVRRAVRGEGLAILTRGVSSPTLAGLMDELLEELPAARWHVWDAAGPAAARRAATEAFGRAVDVRYDLAAADVVVSLDADLFGTHPQAVTLARDFMARRDPDAPDAWNRLYAVESMPTGTGAQADHRLALSPSGVTAFAAALARALDVPGAPRGPIAAPTSVDEARFRRHVDAIASALGSRRGRGAVVPGVDADPEVHVLAHAIDEALGNVGTTVHRTEPVLAGPADPLASLHELVDAMRADDVEMLVVLDGNPVYDAPGALDFTQAFERVPLRVHLGSHVDETALRSHWHVPLAVELESWGDVRAPDGTASVRQPLVAPLYGGRTPVELVAVMLDRDAGPHELVRKHWKTAWGLDGEAFETRWRRALHDGVIEDTVAPDVDVTVDTSALSSTLSDAARDDATLEVAFRLDPTLLDGRHANNGWLQECPRPISRIAWGGALMIAPHDAERLGVTDEDVVTIDVDGRRLDAPVWRVPGHAPGAATLFIGGGRESCGRVGDGVGPDAHRLRPADRPWTARATITPTGDTAPLAAVQEHHLIDGEVLEGSEAERRDLVRDGTLDELVADAAAIVGHEHEPGASLMPAERDLPEGDHQWGMVVDQSRCTACNACVVACQSENNIPVVGPEEVRRGREMHWIRIDRYHSGSFDAPRIQHQPVMCMHCEEAPCEVVCPVSATVHSDEGLNDMVYNRCVGTRYCSNNCPYKVRRFNFLHYADAEEGSVESLGANPDVTVRSRGVMEKCTYCVQRIQSARIDARKDGRPIADGEVQPACVQSCPADALVFGDVSDPDTRVSHRKAAPHEYGLLTQLGTRPRTTYLARIRNVDPALEDDG